MIMIVDLLEVVRGCIDASHKTNDDCRVHTGVMIILGWGTVLILFLENNSNLNSYIERELALSYEGLSVVLWGLKIFKMEDILWSTTICTSILRVP